ncbi:MAG TPA: SGNH/GDSL hydrolase family protein [Gammaproteobacteria bacterium]|nr:SGNH/GDSL hydrolase family protein [Gammaproteobacteria bacterium]
MKKIVFFIFALLLSNTLLAAQLDKIVFFGDSLSDNGNLYNLFGFVPRSPPYYNGRFSNGPIWAELVGNHYQQFNHIPYKIYAYGGTTTYTHSGGGSIFSYTLSDQLSDYYGHVTPVDDKSKNLHVIWIGANDYLWEAGAADENMITSQVVDTIIQTMNDLKSHGARYYLILNLPDLAESPYARQNNVVKELHTLSVLHNEKLARALSDFAAQNPGFKVISLDVHQLFDDLIAHPEKYNQKYQTSLRNVDQACWQGGITLQRRPLSNSPALLIADQVGRIKAHGLAPCDQANQYVFWDQMHPSETIHQILSRIAVEALESQAKDIL